MITVRNLSKRFRDGKEVLSAVSFQIDEGEFVALVGGSGSGKSTLLRCLSLRENWDQGQYIYNGHDITNANLLDKLKLRRKWAYLGDLPGINTNRTALQNVLTSLHLQKAPWKLLLLGRASMEEHMHAMDYLDRVGLLDKATIKSEKLSGGEKQRVALAKSLIRGAKIVVADEPTAGLDQASAAKVMEDLQTLSRKHNVTVICSMNNVEQAEKYASRIWGINEGKIVVDVTGRRLTQREKHLIFQ